jgi:signal transduction histidine kinase/DNA-binding NarL/FixJ family response regulator
MAFIANSFCLLLVIIDFVYAATNHYSSSGEFSTLGFFAFIILYAFILARRFSLSFREVKVLSDKLLTLDKLKDEFLANTSHELRTPLHGIINIAESLLSGVEGGLNTGQEKNLGLIAASGRKLAHLIDDILDASRLKHQDIVLNRKNVPLAPSVESVAMVFRQMYPKKTVTLTSEIPESLPTVYVDENRLVQILYNLIGNAMKFTDSGEVRVTAEAASDWVALSVADTGIGIPPDKLETIFQPFGQGDSSITREYGGAGLGLSITKQLVELHGGRIGVVSVPGQGSRFTVELPIGDTGLETKANEAEPVVSVYEVAAASLSESGWESRAPETRGTVRRGERILVVDDDEVSLQASANLLHLEGYNVTAVTSGKAALERIQADSGFDLVILDVMMPRMSGYEVCRTIRETKPLADLPVLMATAKHQPQELVLGYESGANDFLVKPFEPTEFRARVKTLIEWKHSMNRALQSEIAFLQAQIKPHFIYNTLNTISYFCARDGEKAKELLNCFAAYLRNTFEFRDIDRLVLLEKELNVVSAYLEIEKARFGDRLQVQTDVDAEALHAFVPPFILQPLVENAVRHGIQKKIEGGAVTISVKMKGPDIQVTIRDTGVGMTVEQVNRLLSDGGSSRVGLRNIQLRLKKMYGETVVITSGQDQGTEVSFTITVKGELTA